MNITGAVYTRLIEAGALYGALKVRWFESILENLSLDKQLELWMIFLQTGTFNLREII